MKVSKIPIRPNKIGIDLILCPKTTLYLQDLYCRRCPYYISDDENFIECTFKKPNYGQSDPTKDKLIKDFSSSFIRTLPIENKNDAVNSFTDRLKNSTSTKTKKGTVMDDLDQYIKKSNLSLRLENIKKDTSKQTAN